MPLSRRTMLLSAGGALALVGAGATWRVTRMPQTALRPWTVELEAGLDPRLTVLRYAILAPNAHNRQPWIMRLVGDSEVLLFCDPDRRLPMTDPFDRQITLSFGCFIGLARLAAGSRRLSLEVEPFPEGEPRERLDARPVARLILRPDPAGRPDPLFGAILIRRSNKEPYDMTRLLPAGVFESLRQAAGAAVVFGGTSKADEVASLRALAWEAWQIEVRTPRTHKESVDLMRIGAAEIDASPDGIDLGGPLFEGLKLAGLMSREALADTDSQAFKGGEEAYRALFANTPAFFWLASERNDRATQLAVGEAYVRANLAANTGGLAVHPVSQALQEFPEMAALRKKMQEATGAGSGTLHMLARLGYGPEIPPSPRWPLARRLVA